MLRDRISSRDGLIMTFAGRNLAARESGDTVISQVLSSVMELRFGAAG